MKAWRGVVLRRGAGHAALHGELDCCLIRCKQVPTQVNTGMMGIMGHGPDNPLKEAHGKQMHTRHRTDPIPVSFTPRLFASKGGFLRLVIHCLSTSH